VAKFTREHLRRIVLHHGRDLRRIREALERELSALAPEEIPAWHQGRTVQELAELLLREVPEFGKDEG